MDVQLKKGLLEVCVLAVLKKGDSYGYQIVKDISSCIAMTESTLYPILKRLENSNRLLTYSLEHNGRLRKYYRITPAGCEKIQEFLNEWDSMTKVYQFIEEANRYE